MQVEYNNKKVRFEDLNVGEVFIVPISNTPMMKTKDDTGVFGYINAVVLTSGNYEHFDDDDEVIPKRAKMVIDN